jgi:hypothetical protein
MGRLTLMKEPVEPPRRAPDSDRPYAQCDCPSIACIHTIQVIYPVTANGSHNPWIATHSHIHPCHIKTVNEVWEKPQGRSSTAGGFFKTLDHPL